MELRPVKSQLQATWWLIASDFSHPLLFFFPFLECQMVSLIFWESEKRLILGLWIRKTWGGLSFLWGLIYNNLFPTFVSTFGMGNFSMDKKSNCVASVIRTHYWHPYFECISITSELCGGFCLCCSFCDSISEIILKKWEHWNPALLCVNFNPSIYLWWDLAHVIWCSWLPFFNYYARQLDSYI